MDVRFFEKAKGVVTPMSRCASLVQCWEGSDSFLPRHEQCSSSELERVDGIGGVALPWLVFSGIAIGLTLSSAGG